MKELKHFHAVECTCDKTGLIGDFIVDQEYYKETGKLAALDGKVFKCLVELFRYANENDLKTGKIISIIFLRMLMLITNILIISFVTMWT